MHCIVRAILWAETARGSFPPRSLRSRCCSPAVRCSEHDRRPCWARAARRRCTPEHRCGCEARFRRTNFLPSRPRGPVEACESASMTRRLSRIRAPVTCRASRRSWGGRPGDSLRATSPCWRAAGSGSGRSQQELRRFSRRDGSVSSSTHVSSSRDRRTGSSPVRRREGGTDRFAGESAQPSRRESDAAFPTTWIRPRGRCCSPRGTSCRRISAAASRMPDSPICWRSPGCTSGSLPAWSSPC